MAKFLNTCHTTWNWRPPLGH